MNSLASQIGGQEQEKSVPIVAGIFLMAFGAAIDGLQALLTLFFLSGLVLNPFLSGFAWFVFWVVLKLSGVSMFSSRVRWAAILTIAFETFPLLTVMSSFIPTWFAYAFYLTIIKRIF